MLKSAENNKYIYSYLDHLGNVRLNYFKNSSGSAEVLEENSYYPFGLKHFNNLIVSAYNYQYNGKEYQTETGWSDYGARMYMPDMARWGVIDPLAEQYRRFTPYNYAANNPSVLLILMVERLKLREVRILARELMQESTV